MIGPTERGAKGGKRGREAVKESRFRSAREIGEGATGGDWLGRFGGGKDGVRSIAWRRCPDGSELGGCQLRRDDAEELALAVKLRDLPRLGVIAGELMDE